MDTKSKIKIGMVQINNSFLKQNYFPYSLGFLQAYSEKYLKNIDDFEFLLPIYKRIPLESAVSVLSEADIIFFSVYVWNFKISSEIAKRIKEKRPNALIVFGGCRIPKRGIEHFLSKAPFIDIICYGEGERVFKAILENYKTANWQNVPSISYVDKGNNIVSNPKAERINNLDEIPSPYLAGVFDALIKTNPEEQWLGLWETNRGCPFGCSYCEWGGDYQKRLYIHGLGKLFDEIDWFSRNKIEFIFCCDANFGILERDLKIVERVAENKKKYGYPKALSVQNTKNSTDSSYNIQKVLAKAGLSKGVNLAFQSLNEETLNSIGRKNISTKTFYELQHKFHSEGIETFSDIILGLPNETYDTFTKGVSRLIENGQHNRIQFNNLSILPNSAMADKEYQEKYGLITRETKIVNIHGSLDQADGIYETQELVVGTKAMPQTDWVKARAFSWMISLLYFDKVLQIPLVLLHNICRVDFKELIEIFQETEIYSFFADKARDLQKGGTEYCRSEKWLNIWWPADELILIKLCAENKLSAFYKKAKQEIERFLKEKNLNFPLDLLDEAIYLNKNLIKLPFQNDDVNIRLSYNILEVYQSFLKGISLPIEKGIYNYRINSKSETWPSWEDWCREVVWYENKKGAYLYSIHMNKISKKKVLVCGATGFIGRNMAEYFAKRDDFEVFGTYFDSEPLNNQRIKMIQTDLTRREDVDKVVKGMDIIIQAAATTSGAKDTFSKPYYHVTDNAIINSLIFRAAHKYKLSHIVFFSCTTMYQPSEVPVKETDFDANQEMIPAYFGGAWTKVYLERMAEFYSRMGRTKYTIIRHSNMYGPYDKFDLERSHVFGATMTKVMTAKEGGEIIVWGMGEEERDLLYISDLIDFVELAITKQESTFELYNVGIGSLISVSSLVQKIIQHSGKNIKIKYDKSKPTIKTKLCLDCSKARKKLGWAPRVSLDEGIKKTMAWYKNLPR